MNTAVLSPPASVALAPVPATHRSSLVAKIANRYGVDSDKLLATLKATAFRQQDGKPPATNEQLMALLVVADQYRLNPFTKEIYAFADKGGIVPVVGLDGWARIINEQEKFDGLSFSMPEDGSSCTCTIYRKDRGHPTEVTEYLAECKRSTGPWGSHPRRMLRHKALIQTARLAFGFAGIYDDDEARRIVEGEAGAAPAPLRKGQTVTLDALAARATLPSVERVDGETGEIEPETVEPPKPTYAMLAYSILTASDGETAGLLLDSSRDWLSPELQAELAEVWKRKWGDA